MKPKAAGRSGLASSEAVARTGARAPAHAESGRPTRRCPNDCTDGMVDAVMPYDGTGSNCIDCRTALVVCALCDGAGVVPIRCQNGPCGRDAVVSFGGLALCGACAVAAGWTPAGGARAVAMTGRHGAEAESGMVAPNMPPDAATAQGRTDADSAP